MFNERDNVVDCLEAILANRDPGLPWELVVMDDGSSDGTVDLASEAIRLRTEPLPLVRILEAGPRPPGERWCGKNWPASRAAALPWPPEIPPASGCCSWTPMCAWIPRPWRLLSLRLQVQPEPWGEVGRRSAHPGTSARLWLPGRVAGAADCGQPARSGIFVGREQRSLRDHRLRGWPLHAVSSQGL
ncbi:glycosyltransferase [Cyanobium sp. ATX-6F1]|uniref:glycosyltransferase n=1 Tax=Cyanobium sp. ATX-6F1 TaxID=3137388 RepID=UPI0039BE0856